MKYNKPFLKWAGRKHKLVPFIASNLPKINHQRLIEPFAGSAALSLALEFDEYWLNDINKDLITLYIILKSEKKAFIQYAQSFFTQENNREMTFYTLRERFNNSQDDIERSALFIYLNRHGFNGLCRYNKSGLFNVPYGKYKNPYFPEHEMLVFISKADKMMFSQTDFASVLQNTESEDIVYCDPPYAPLTETADFTSYAKEGFNLEDQIRLAEAATKLSSQCHILISNHDTPFTRKIYAHARLELIDVQRHIAAKGSSRKKVGELLAIYE